MVFFGSKLSAVESQLLKNTANTKTAFSEETQLIEFGLNLMRDIAYETKDIARDYQRNPDLLTNQNLFARNRELLLNAYFCMLSSSYGTLVAILRVVMENAFLMRLFKKKPQFAFEWLSKGIQEQFSNAIKSKCSKSGISDRRIKVDLNKAIFRGVVTETARNDVNNLYKQLSDYSHPNFVGWTHLTSLNEGGGILQSIPRFSKEYTEETIGMMLYFMQLSFKAFYETFKDSLQSYDTQLTEWQENFKRLMKKHERKRILS